MKVLKFSLIFSLIIAAGAYFNNSIAQTFGNNDVANYNFVSPRQKLIIELLKQEMNSNDAFADYKQAIIDELDSASDEDLAGPECYKYSPLLVEAVNSNEKFLEFFYVQGNFKYSFSSPNDTLTTFTFYEWPDDNGDFKMLVSYVDIKNKDKEENLKNMEAIDYIVDNYCKPLNQVLDQNANRPIPQLLQILRQRFSK